MPFIAKSLRALRPSNADKARSAVWNWTKKNPKKTLGAGLVTGAAGYGAFTNSSWNERNEAAEAAADILKKVWPAALAVGAASGGAAALFSSKTHVPGEDKGERRRRILMNALAAGALGATATAAVPTGYAALTNPSRKRIAPTYGDMARGTAGAVTKGALWLAPAALAAWPVLGKAPIVGGMNILGRNKAVREAAKKNLEAFAKVTAPDAAEEGVRSSVMKAVAKYGQGAKKQEKYGRAIIEARRVDLDLLGTLNPRHVAFLKNFRSLDAKDIEFLQRRAGLIGQSGPLRAIVNNERIGPEHMNRLRNYMDAFGQGKYAPSEDLLDLLGNNKAVLNRIGSSASDSADLQRLIRLSGRENTGSRWKNLGRRFDFFNPMSGVDGKKGVRLGGKIVNTYGAGTQLGSTVGAGVLGLSLGSQLGF